MLAGIAEPLIGLADTAILGNLPDHSTAALAAVGIATQFFLFMFWTFVQSETALSSIVARFLGQKEVNKLEPLVNQGLALNVIVGMILFVGTTAASRWIFGLYNAEGLQLDYAVAYYDVRALGFPVVLAMGALWGVFRGLQNTSWAMVIMLIGGATNLVLDIVLVYGIEDLIPAYGVVGAAWASFAAQCLMLLITIFVMVKKTSFRLRRWWPIHEKFAHLLGLSGNFIIRTIALNLVLFLASARATDLGAPQMAAHAIAMQLWLLSAFFLDGYANAGLAIGGKLLGEKRFKALDNLTGRLVKIGMFVALAIMLGYSGVYYWIGTWFSNDPVVVEQFNRVFWLVILCQPLSSLAFTLDGLLKGLAEGKYLMLMMVVGLVVFWLILHAVGLFTNSFESVWVALLGWMAIRSIWPYLFFRRNYGGR
jgi:multidrug resistance protein, MATE family